VWSTHYRVLTRITLSVQHCGWSLAAVGTVQSGDALTILYTNSKNVFGINQDRAQLSGSCTKGQIVTSGTVQSKLNNYFGKACFTTPPIIGADGIGTAFGDSATGIANGPGQANLDLSLARTVSLRWPKVGSSLQLRAEFSMFSITLNLAIPTTTSAPPSSVGSAAPRQFASWTIGLTGQLLTRKPRLPACWNLD
jgi:hypothetical protein